jgi:hypothetical protein
MGKTAEVKTKLNTASVTDFLNGLSDEQKRKDSFELVEMMKKATGDEPKMWGDSLIGFGELKHTSPSGREVDWFQLGFAPRKANLSLYFMDFKKHGTSLEKLGKHKMGSGCLYINKLADIDMKVLKEMIETASKEKWNNG